MEIGELILCLYLLLVALQIYIPLNNKLFLKKRLLRVINKHLIKEIKKPEKQEIKEDNTHLLVNFIHHLEQLENTNDVGKITAKSIFDYFKDEENIRILERLKEFNVVPSHKENENDGILDRTLEGLKFVFTGTLKNFGRDLASSLVEKKGAKVSSTVTKKTSYLVAGEDSGSKLEKAKSFNVKILDEDEFVKLINL